jgi:glycosyltransferase involved in cell wall biosynthesis
MKIAVLTDGIYPFVIGGMQRHSYFLIKYLAQRDCEIRVYHCIHPENEKDYKEKLEIVFTKDELKNIEFVKIPFDFVSHYPGFYLLESYRYSKRIYEHLIKDIQTFDFIYSKGFTAWYLLQHKKNHFPKIGIKLHGYEMYQYAPDLKTKLQHYTLRIPAKFVTQNADVIFSYGGKITTLLSEVLNVPLEKIVEIPTGIEKQFIYETCTEYHHPVRFVFVGRYEKRKGIENLNVAIQKLIEKNIEFQFHFIGDIPTSLQINNDRVKYYGKINEFEKIQSIIRQSDVLVVPSYSEGMPNVIVEGMASGLTVVATNVGAVSLLVNDKTGYLLENNDVERLTNVLIQICTEKKEVLQSKKMAALQHIQNFVWEKIIDKVIESIRKYGLPR